MIELFWIFMGIFACFGICWITWSVGYLFGYHRGFQSGVKRAIEEMEKSLGKKYE
jgi:hypothetical protein